MEVNESLLKISALTIDSAKKCILKKAVCSKSADKTIVKATITPRLIGGTVVLQAEILHKDNKATHKNFAITDNAYENLVCFMHDYLQVNLICCESECEYRLSKSGNSVLLGEKKLQQLLDNSDSAAPKIPISENNVTKRHILSGSEPFLRELGVSDENGRVYDKKQAKFRQINRFLEIIRDTEDKLPKENIRICDLCCGKSYLSFAAYHYFANIRKMKVCMTGVDLKSDVVDYCNHVAEKLGFDGLEFVCMNINDYTPRTLPSLVISLHACDFATDIVLGKATEWKTDVILATPCCHHELNHNIDCEALSFITKHSMLRQKLCDAATDALRLCKLESQGYDTAAIELIDPNETPKNIMLRAVYKKNFDPNSPAAKKALERYITAKEFLCGKNDTSAFHF